MVRTVRIFAVLRMASPFAIAVTVAAQCGLQWQPGAGLPGPIGGVFDIDFASNGDPIVVGTFQWASRARVDHVARWDGNAWQPLGTGVDDVVFTVRRHSSGDLWIGGSFTVASGVTAPHVARWDGSAWLAVGGGVGGRVDAILEVPGGDVIVGGQFAMAGGIAAANVARWNGSTWSALGSGTPSAISALARMPNGDVIAGGSTGLQRWDGVAWSPISGSLGTVISLAVTPAGLLLAGGSMNFGPPGGLPAYEALVQWNGTQITPLVTPFSGINELRIAPNGDVIAAGTGAPPTTSLVARWNGSVWSPLTPAPSAGASSLAVAASGRLLCGGGIGPDGFTKPSVVKEWTGVAWSPLGGPPAPDVKALCRGAHDELYVGGAFAAIESVAAANLARRQAGSWSAVGGGVGGKVTAMTVLSSGDLLVSGDFQAVGGGPANRIARWNGTSWSTLGAGVPQPAESLAALPNGDVWALLGNYYPLQPYRFDGVSWQLQILPPLYGVQPRLLVDRDGTLWISGAQGQLLRLQGGVVTTEALPVASAGGPMLVDRGGRLVVGAGGYVLRREPNGSWLVIDDTTVGSVTGSATSLVELPNGDLIAVGNYVVQGQSVGVRRFDGVQWTVVDGGVRDGIPRVAEGLASGELFVGGRQLTVASGFAVGLTQANPTCPAAAAVFGTGCTGAAGPVVLQASSMPWAGSTFAATAAGFVFPLAVRMIGDPAATTPLPLGGPGCSAYVQPFALDALPVQAGAADASFAIPRLPALAGLALRMQTVGIELTSGGDLARLSSSNALALQIGVL